MRPLSRRAFLTTGGTAALAFVTLKAGVVSAKTVSSAAEAVGLRHAAVPRLGSAAAPFTHAAFQPHVDTQFGAHVGARTIDLQLTGVKLLHQRTSKGAAVRGQQFSLTFHGPGPAFHQETYNLEHGVLGHFSLFLVPVGTPGTTKSGQTYEAIINNITV
jgi:hypothetical protein